MTPKAILSFPHLDKPQKADKADQQDKYGCALVFLPGTDLTEMKKLALEIAIKEFGAEYTTPAGKKIPLAEAIKAGIYKWPFRTDEKATTMKGFPEGSTVTNVRSNAKPGVVYPHADPVTGKPAAVADVDIKQVFYPGALVRATLSCFAYKRPDSKGVTFGLNNLQKLGEGERIDGRVAAENDFDAQLDQPPADISSLV